jgi:hypothetical protein
MTNANTLERWRPHPLVFIYCALAIVFLGSACFWGIALLVARWYQPESAVKAALAGTVLFVAVLLLALRRCSTPALPAFRGLLLITGYMTIGEPGADAGAGVGCGAAASIGKVASSAG